MLARAQRDDERVVREPDRRGRRRDAAPAAGAGAGRIAGAAAPSRGPTFEERLQARLAKHRRVDPTDLPAAGAALDPGRGRRGGAGRGRRTPGAAGARRAEPAAPLRRWRCCGPHDADEHGFGERARTHATIALRAAADAWPVLDRLLELRVPDQLVLDTDELVSLLDEGVGALRERGVDVLWPRSLGRDLSATATLDRATPAAHARGAAQRAAARDRGAVRLQVAGGAARRPADRRRDGPARVVGDPADAAARQLDGRRPGDRPQGPQAAAAHGQAGRGGGGRADRRRPGRTDGHGRTAGAGGRRRQPAQGARAAAHAPRPASRSSRRPR